MKVEILSGVFKGDVFRVVQPDFDQQLIGCMDAETDDDTISFFRCENCEIVNHPQL